MITKTSFGKMAKISLQMNSVALRSRYLSFRAAALAASYTSCLSAKIHNQFNNVHSTLMVLFILPVLMQSGLATADYLSVCISKSG